MANWIASTEFLSTSPRGSQVTITVRVGAPEQREETWWCGFEIVGIDLAALRATKDLHAISVATGPTPSSNPATTRGEIAGDDSLQALMLAMALVGWRLENFIEAGGRLEYLDGGPVRLHLHFPPVPPEPR